MLIYNSAIHQLLAFSLTADASKKILTAVCHYYLVNDRYDNMTDTNNTFDFSHH